MDFSQSTCLVLFVESEKDLHLEFELCLHTFIISLWFQSSCPIYDILLLLAIVFTLVQHLIIKIQSEDVNYSFSDNETCFVS